MQASFAIPAGATFQEYVNLSLPEDEVSEFPLSLKAMQGAANKEKGKGKGDPALTGEEQVVAYQYQSQWHCDCHCH